MIEYHLVEASPADEPWLDALRRRAYADLFDRTWGGWDEDRHARHLSACLDRGHISVIEVGGLRVGMIQILTHPDHVEVAEIQIDPEHQGRGVGSAVLRHVLESARGHGLPVRLSVGLRNRQAIDLYHRLGFVIAERSDTHCHMIHEAPA